MFGDVGHGLILLALTTWLFRTSAKRFHEIKKARYLLLLMSLSSIYSGFIYNEFFSVPILTGSCYRPDGRGGLRSQNGCRPVFGFDPVWLESPNGMPFINSFKMKISVIFGLLHMLSGLGCKAVNFVYFGKKVQILS